MILARGVERPEAARFRPVEPQQALRAHVPLDYAQGMPEHLKPILSDFLNLIRVSWGAIIAQHMGADDIGKARDACIWLCRQKALDERDWRLEPTALAEVFRRSHDTISRSYERHADRLDLLEDMLAEHFGEPYR